MPIITREEIKQLIEHPRGNCVSIYLPTYQGGAETRQNPIRFKNLIREAEEQLITAGLSEEEAAQLLQPAHELDTEDFWQNQDEGLAIFISTDFLQYYRLPLSFEELTVVSDRFHVKPLMPILNNNGRFYVLALSQNKVRLVAASRYQFRDVDLTAFEGIPTSLEKALEYDDNSEKQLIQHNATPGNAAGGAQAGVFHGQGAGGEDHKVDIMRFCQQLNRGLQQILRNQDAPLVLAAVDYIMPIYAEANTYAHLLEEGIIGNPESLKPEELHAKALPIVEEYFHASQQQVVERYQELAGAETGKASSDIKEIVPAACFQRIESLLVAVGQHQWGLFDPGSEAVYIHEEEEVGDEDLLDLAAAHTLLNGGTVYAVEPSEVPEGAMAAAIFRY